LFIIVLLLAFVPAGCPVVIPSLAVTPFHQTAITQPTRKLALVDLVFGFPKGKESGYGKQ
jgi:hypothetical protein